MANANVNPLELVGQMPPQEGETLDMSHGSSSDQVSTWLQDCGLGEFAQTFRSAGYDDINLIKILNEEDLDAMGIDKPGTRKKILMYADQLKNIHDPQPPLLEQRITQASPVQKKGNRRANPYRCTKCCEFKIRSLDGKAHVCKPELIGHTWEQCPTQNIRQHPEERARRKQNQKLNKGRNSRKRKTSLKTIPDEEEEVIVPSAVTAWEYSGEHYQTQESAGFAPPEYSDEHGQPIFAFEASPHKRMKIDISQQVADVSAAVMENYISDEIAKQLGGGDLDPHTITLPASSDHIQF